MHKWLVSPPNLPHVGYSWFRPTWFHEWIRASRCAKVPLDLERVWYGSLYYIVNAIVPKQWRLWFMALLLLLLLLLPVSTIYNDSYIPRTRYILERGASGFFVTCSRSTDQLTWLTWLVVALQVLLSTLRGAPLKKIALVAVAGRKGVWSLKIGCGLRMAILVIPYFFFKVLKPNGPVRFRGSSDGHDNDIVATFVISKVEQILKKKLGIIHMGKQQKNHSLIFPYWVP